MEMDTKILRYADKFKVDRHLVKEIFVDETLVKIDGQNYWLWIAYDEPNIHTFVLVISYIKRKNDFCMLSIFQADQNEIWKKETNLH
jgi:hypothetical protein